VRRGLAALQYFKPLEKDNTTFGFQSNEPSSDLLGGLV